MNLRKKAERLAFQPYTEQVIKDVTTDNEPIFISISPELDGCISQGKSIDEALANLKAARVDFIQSLLEDNLPVPKPHSFPTITTSSPTANFAFHFFPGKEAKDLKPIENQPNSSSLTRFVGASLGS